MGRSVIALAVAALAVCGAAAAEPRARIEGVDDRALLQAIEQAVGEAEKPATRFEARRRARDAGERAIAVLRSEGYYAYEVEADLGEGESLDPIVRITPGPRFLLTEPQLAWVGAPPADAAAQGARKVLNLKAGEPGRAVDVLAAEGRIVASLQKSGYADTVAEPREVVVDHAGHTVAPTFRINAGDLVRLDGLRLESGGNTSREWLASLTPWSPGAAYDPEAVAELERRLRDTGVYDSVTVALTPKDQIGADGLRPVVVSLADRSRRTIELGAGYSTSEGVGLDGRWLHYNRLGRADTITVTGRVAELDQHLSTELSFPHWRKPQRTLRLGAELSHEDTDAYEETRASVRADLTRRYGRLSYLTWGVSLNLKNTFDGKVFLDEKNAVTVAGLGALALDHSDDVLDPRRGWRVELRAEPTMAVGGTLAYTRVQGQGAGYLPLGSNARIEVAARIKTGTILGGSLAEVTPSQRFFVGGGGSVRGYAYQAVGPRFADAPVGGVSFLEGSVELRRQITERWGGVIFVDAGRIPTQSLGDQKFPSDVGVGVGLGVRYDLGFGPIRADIAVPLKQQPGDPSFQIYLSIGQSF